MRFTVGDTDATTYHLSDPEIEALLSTTQNPIMAAARAAQAIAAKYAACTDESGGGISKANSQLFEHYTKLAASLLTRGAKGSMRVPAVSQSAKDEDAQDEDLVQPYFTTEMHRNPRGRGLDEDNAEEDV